MNSEHLEREMSEKRYITKDIPNMEKVNDKMNVTIPFKIKHPVHKLCM